MELIYIVTHKCNLRCHYCPVKKKDFSLKRTVINNSLNLFKKVPAINKIKLFGGEPLLEFAVLKYLVSQLKKIKPDLVIEMTTNAVLLDQSKIAWLKKNKIVLSVSLDGNAITQRLNRQGADSFSGIIKIKDRLPLNTIFNLVVAPNTAKYFQNNFQFLISLGMRRFNLLPAYYNDWTAGQLAVLKRNFSLVGEFIKEKGLKTQLYLKNLDNYTEQAFFNQAIVIDCDGKLYNTNAFLAASLAASRDQFYLGNVCDLENFKYIKLPAGEIESLVPPSVTRINQQLDSLLNNFIYKYKKIS